MKFDRGLMRFFADLQDQPKRERISVERYRLVFAAVDQQVRYLVMPLWRFDEADEHYLFEIERLHRGRGGRKLAFAAVDKYELRQRLFFVDACGGTGRKTASCIDAKSLAPSTVRIIKRRYSCTCRLAVLKYDDAGDIFRA